MKKLLDFQDILTATRFKDILESNGIACLIKNYYLVGASGMLPPAECALQLWILDDAQYLTALTLIEQNQQPVSSGKSWKCTKCGELNEAQFGVCWKCENSQ